MHPLKPIKCRYLYNSSNYITSNRIERFMLRFHVKREAHACVSLIAFTIPSRFSSFLSRFNRALSIIATKLFKKKNEYSHDWKMVPVPKEDFSHRSEYVPPPPDPAE